MASESGYTDYQYSCAGDNLHDERKRRHGKRHQEITSWTPDNERDFSEKFRKFMTKNIEILLDHFLLAHPFLKYYDISDFSSGKFKLTKKAPSEWPIPDDSDDFLVALFVRYDPKIWMFLGDLYLNNSFRNQFDSFIEQNEEALSTHAPLVVHPLPNPIHSPDSLHCLSEEAERYQFRPAAEILQILRNIADLDPTMPL